MSTMQHPLWRSAVANEESFDSADMEEEDPHEGVGVDERAASLDPEDFVRFLPTHSSFIEPDSVLGCLIHPGLGLGSGVWSLPRLYRDILNSTHHHRKPQLLDDDQPWYPSARWVLGRDETVSFIAAALISHLAPLYVPFASNTALTPTEVR